MKYLTLTLTILFTISSCQRPKYTGETQEIVDSKAGTLIISSVGYGNTKKIASRNAIQNAFKNILLKGIPDSNQSSPLLGSNPESIYDNNKQYFEKFLEKEKDQFILQQDLGRFQPSINEGSVKVKLKIDVAGLRRTLENDNIIRKFGI